MDADAGKIRDFLKTKLGVSIIVIVLCVLVIGGYGYLRESSEKSRKDPQGVVARPAEPEKVKSTYEREVAALPKADTMPRNQQAQQKVVMERVGIWSEKPQPDQTPQSGQTQIRRFSEDFAPYGRLVKCELLNTLESNKIQTPIIGIVMEDVWWNGRLIIPAGAEVHGRAVADRTRDRIGSANQWTVVLPAFEGRVNGEEIVIKGMALDRDEDLSIQNPGDLPLTWGNLDGSWGIRGSVIRDDKYAAVKLYASQFIGEAAKTLIQRTVTGTGGFIGGAVVQNDSTLQNAALAGLSKTMDQYIAEIQREVQENGVYIRVNGGKQFYLYVQQTVDINDARIGDSLVGDQIQGQQGRSALEAEIRRNESTRPIIIQQGSGASSYTPRIQQNINQQTGSSSTVVVNPPVVNNPMPTLNNNNVVIP